MFLLALHSTGWAQACTEASARNRRRAIGVPTMALRPSTTARRPRNSTPYARSSSITPAGVHGTASGCAAPPPPRGGHPAACKPPRPPRDTRASRAERGLVCGEGGRGKAMVPRAGRASRPRMASSPALRGWKPSTSCKPHGFASPAGPHARAGVPGARAAPGADGPCRARSRPEARPAAQRPSYDSASHSMQSGTAEEPHVLATARATRPRQGRTSSR
jgi:hypothetical protein